MNEKWLRLATVVAAFLLVFTTGFWLTRAGRPYGMTLMMYLAVTIMVIFSALALGSYWALSPAVLFPLVLVARILNEEKVLRRDLKGYAEYCATVRYRLIPGVW